jgi:ketosteroid isomerase-like protein
MPMRPLRLDGHDGRMTNPQTTPDATLSDERGAPIATIRALYAAFGRGDLDAMLALIDPDVDWSLQVDAPDAALVPMFRNGRGHDAVRHYFSGVADLDFNRFVPVRFLADGDTVIVQLEVDFTHRVTGKRARLEEIQRFVVSREGKIVHYRPFVDTATFIDVFRD